MTATSLIMQTWNLKIFLTTYYVELQPQKREKMDNTQMEGQTNNKEPTPAGIMASLCNIANSIIKEWNKG